MVDKEKKNFDDIINYFWVLSYFLDRFIVFSVIGMNECHHNLSHELLLYFKKVLSFWGGTDKYFLNLWLCLRIYFIFLIFNMQ